MKQAPQVIKLFFAALLYGLYGHYTMKNAQKSDLKSIKITKNQ